MPRIPAQSVRAARAAELLESLQIRFVQGLEGVARAHGDATSFDRIEWLRDGGRHGGGVRYAVAESSSFNRGSVNVSGVHYDDDPDRRLSSADALSTIIHPRDPRAPSVHMHFSWTEMRDGRGYWRMMADLNPPIEEPAIIRRFAEILRAAAPAQYEEARAQGERYFYIPALGRHRGATHFYLEDFSTGDFDQDCELARALAEAGIDGYVGILRDALMRGDVASPDQRAQQLAYHTLYFFQVLTLDRGTTSGLLIHDQNDLGIMGSLPSYVDRELLASWESGMPEPQNALLRALVAVLPETSPAHVTDEVRQALATVVRAHYKAHPEALELQAMGNVVPPTVENHGGGAR